MPQSHFRIVLDTNIVVRACINLQSHAGRILNACERRRVVPLLSKPVLDEYRNVLGDPELISRYPQLEAPDVAVALERLLYVSDMYPRVRVRFEYPRDPDDSHLIELSITGRATHLISTDDDLLALPGGRDDAARRFRQRLPALKVMTAEEFVLDHGSELGIL